MPICRDSHETGGVERLFRAATVAMLAMWMAGFASPVLACEGGGNVPLTGSVLDWLTAPRSASLAGPSWDLQGMRGVLECCEDRT